MQSVPCIPRKGSKRRLATRIVDLFPSSDTFVDLFAGGGAVTTAAMISGKYRRFIMNDITKGLTELYRTAAQGFIDPSKTGWVSYEDFRATFRENAFVNSVWSFGNDGHSYIYSHATEPIKRAVHKYIVDGDKSEVVDYFDELPELTGATVNDRRLQWGQWARSAKLGHRASQTEHLDRIVRVASIGDAWKRVQHLERVDDFSELHSCWDANAHPHATLSCHCSDYQRVEFPMSAVVYADIPYKGTSGYRTGKFDYDRFYDWCRESPVPVYVSEYQMPSDFVCIAEFAHHQSICATKCTPSVERVFVHNRWASKSG